MSELEKLVEQYRNLYVLLVTRRLRRGWGQLRKLDKKIERLQQKLQKDEERR